jgi:translation elongation factor EF-1beta
MMRGDLNMKRTIIFSLIALAILLVAACSNNKQNESTQLKKVTTDTIQKVKPLSGEISLDKLPNNIKEYVNKNFHGYTIKKASYDPLCTGEDAIDVSIIQKRK